MTRWISRYAEDLADLAISIVRASGKALIKSYGQVGDGLQADMQFARRVGMLDECHVSALDAHGRNSRLPRKPASEGETDEAYRMYLGTRWTRARRRGSVEEMRYQLARLGYASTTVTTQLDLDQLGITGAFGGYQGFFFVDIDATNGFSESGAWDDGENWDDGERWNFLEPYVGALDEMKATIRRFKPVGTSCRFVRIRIGDEWLVAPVGELWEIDAAGNFSDVYHFHW